MASFFCFGLLLPRTDAKCTPGFKLADNKCVKCGIARYYCVQGKSIEVSPGYYSTGGTWSTRTGQYKCGSNSFYCQNGIRRKARVTQYTAGGNKLTRTGVKSCKHINDCGVQETCTKWNDQKCPQCKQGFRRVQSDGKPDTCKKINEANIKKNSETFVNVQSNNRYTGHQDRGCTAVSGFIPMNPNNPTQSILIISLIIFPFSPPLTLQDLMLIFESQSWSQKLVGQKLLGGALKVLMGCTHSMP